MPNAFSATQVNVTLNCEMKPFATNAVWNSDEFAVQWSAGIADSDIPAIMFAAWSMPNADVQKQFFGETLLAGEPLAKFVYWYRGLTDKQRQRYDAFLDTLAPGSDLLGKLDDFEFTDDAKLAEVARNLLKEAIDDAR